MSLAERLGMTLNALLTSMSSNELLMWMAYDNIQNDTKNKPAYRDLTKHENAQKEFEKWGKFNHIKKPRA